ncbi:FAD-dependent oxidoreductase [Aspergillus homomorphus CBS 101889]|uniref:FAD binding domain protein n=1 Tax=Aspergillus homomorphus (strain CBS 101889) TaxID=1450537 RepID=A0A395HHE0_ASPHC|nr:FAD binding domain protein [Aspergillus homomorphus CBS 101889]RAL06913.1 FAD binding domain protein [Aspergillus homomorphus CBS 101889]
MADLPILLAGAGISGLLLAQYLHQHNIPYRLFEQDASIDARSGGWGLTLHWALPALRELLPEHLVARLPETYVNKAAAARGDTGHFQFFELQTGSALYSVPAAERIRVSRVRLRQLLATDLTIQWNKTLQNIDSTSGSVTAYFHDGTSYTGCILIGCDGSRSRTREILYPEGHEMNPLPVQLLGGAALYSPEEMAGAESFDPFIFQGSHPDTNVFFFFSLLDTPNNFEESSKDKYLCQIIISWADAKRIPVPSNNGERIALMKSLTANWAEPFKGLVHRLPESTEVRSIRIADWLFRPDPNPLHPRVVLMGDSAHTMTMFRGEGANNAIVDVLDFTKRVDLKSMGSLTTNTLRECLAVYESDVLTRAEPSVLNSRQACLDAHDFSRIVDGSPLVSARLRE